MVSTAERPGLGSPLPVRRQRRPEHRHPPQQRATTGTIRPTLGVPEDQILPINDELGFHPTMAPLKKFWEAGQLAVFLGIGYPTPSYSHFRSMDIWHTCEPEIIGTEGWLGRAAKLMDPNAENVLTWALTSVAASPAPW